MQKNNNQTIGYDIQRLIWAPASNSTAKDDLHPQLSLIMKILNNSHSSLCTWLMWLLGQSLRKTVSSFSKINIVDVSGLSTSMAFSPYIQLCSSNHIQCYQPYIYRVSSADLNPLSKSSPAYSISILRYAKWPNGSMENGLQNYHAKLWVFFKIRIFLNDFL